VNGGGIVPGGKETRLASGSFNTIKDGSNSTGFAIFLDQFGDLAYVK